MEGANTTDGSKRSGNQSNILRAVYFSRVGAALAKDALEVFNGPEILVGLISGRMPQNDSNNTIALVATQRLQHMAASLMTIGDLLVSPLYASWCDQFGRELFLSGLPIFVGGLTVWLILAPSISAFVIVGATLPFVARKYDETLDATLASNVPRDSEQFSVIQGRLVQWTLGIMGAHEIFFQGKGGTELYKQFTLWKQIVHLLIASLWYFRHIKRKQLGIIAMRKPAHEPHMVASTNKVSNLLAFVRVLTSSREIRNLSLLKICMSVYENDSIFFVWAMLRCKWGLNERMRYALMVGIVEFFVPLFRGIMVRHLGLQGTIGLHMRVGALRIVCEGLFAPSYPIVLFLSPWLRLVQHGRSSLDRMVGVAASSNRIGNDDLVQAYGCVEKVTTLLVSTIYTECYAWLASTRYLECMHIFRAVFAICIPRGLYATIDTTTR
jgi:hypothetical protein